MKLIAAMVLLTSASLALAEPIKLSSTQLDQVVAGTPPWTNNGGHNPPGQTPNPNPGK
jgi:hypothetical protein